MKDPIEGNKWLRKSAKQGDPAAQWTLGSLILSSEPGVTGGLQEGVDWLEKAAGQGFVPAQLDLGKVCLKRLEAVMLNNERDSNPNLYLMPADIEVIEAYVWLTIAAASDDQLAPNAAQLRDTVKLPNRLLKEATRRAKTFAPSPHPFDYRAINRIVLMHLRANMVGAGEVIAQQLEAAKANGATPAQLETIRFDVAEMLLSGGSTYLPEDKKKEVEKLCEQYVPPDHPRREEIMIQVPLY